MSGSTFGVINGIIDMLALLTGLWATKVSKIGIIGAIIALVISNPFNDSYALYLSEENENEKEQTNEKAKKKATYALVSQLTTHLMFLIIVILSPNTTVALITSFICSGLLIFGFNLYNKVPINKTGNTIIIISILVGLTYLADNAVYKYLH